MELCQYEKDIVLNTLAFGFLEGKPSRDFYSDSVISTSQPEGEKVMKLTQEEYDKLLNAMVDAFLGWELPRSFGPDAGISFDRTYSEKYPTCWPVGTNLFAAIEAKEMFEACFKHTDIVVLPPESEPEGEKVMSTKNYAVSDVPAMSAERVFILPGLDRSRALRLRKTEEIVEYRGYTPTYQLIVHPINHEDPYYLIAVGLGDLENVPEPGVAYIKVSDRPFDGSTKMCIPFRFDEDILSSLK